MSRQTWHKHDVIFEPAARPGWARSHAQVPTPDWTTDGKLRIYFGSRDKQNRTSTLLLEVNPRQPREITRLLESPVLPLGELGCFDDAGVMPSCVVTVGQRKYLYYTGWNTSTTVPYRNSIGLAVSDDGGLTYQRLCDGPVLDRSAREPHFCACPFVLHEAGGWRMWYLSCTQWQLVDGKPEARYLIRYTESSDGIEWQKPGTIAINYIRSDEAIARPWVVKTSRGYQMWYSTRSIANYRQDARQSYRLGYAESNDGIAWQRKDELVDLPLSTAGWDSEMIAYPATFDADGRRYLLYNGNGFGASGFGLAELRGAA
jgi:predicted GH43/DUF377 family glycosyl hydrolase